MPRCVCGGRLVTRGQQWQVKQWCQAQRQQPGHSRRATGQCSGMSWAPTPQHQDVRMQASARRPAALEAASAAAWRGCSITCLQ
jgi:hypothetical protein